MTAPPRWVGGVWVPTPAGPVLLDAGPQAASHPQVLAGLERLHAVVITRSHVDALGGLLGVLMAAHRAGRTTPLTVIFPLGLPRVAEVLAAWSSGWPGAMAVISDERLPGPPEPEDGFGLTLHPIACAQREGDALVAGSGVAVRVHQASGDTVWLPNAKPSTGARMLVHGAAHAFVQVATLPWPAHEVPWRRSLADATLLGAHADAVTFVGDDGEQVHPDAWSN